MNIIENFIGFLWGVACTIVAFDIFTDAINCNYLWLYIPLFLVLFIGTICTKIYLFITDYTTLAETGLSFSKKIYYYFSKHKDELVKKS